MQSIKQILIKLIDTLYRSRKVLLALSCLVVFIVTYVLILPAFTLEKDEAAELGGIDVPGVEQSEEDAAAEDSEEKASDKTAAEKAEQAKTDKQNKKGESTGNLTFEGDGFTVAVDDKKSVLPDNTEVVASELLEKPAEGTKSERRAAEKAYKKYYDLALEAVNDDAKDGDIRTISFVKFYDIALQSSGEEVQPEKPVNVTIAYDEKQQKDLRVEEKGNVKIVHFSEDKDTGEITAELLQDKSVDVALDQKKMAETTFEAEGFSVYAVVYTVDLHYEVSGETFDFSFNGGGAASLRDLIKALNVVDSVENESGVKLSKADIAEAFLRDVDKVEFSDESLVKVAKVDENTSAGNLKASLGLQPEYSAELTEEDIAKIDAKEFTAPDWALISLKPFDTEETLTVTMKNGDVFTVKVTDSQDPFGLDGQLFEIIVNNSKALSPVDDDKDFGGQIYHFLNDASPSSGSNLAWKFEYSADAFGEGKGGYYISHEGQYLRMVGDHENDTSRTVTLVNDKSQATPISVHYDQSSGKYSFSNDAEGTKGFLQYFNNDYFGVAGSSGNENAWFELKNPQNPNIPGFVSPWDIKSDNIKLKLFDYTGKVNGNNDIDSKWGTDYSASVWRRGSGVNNNRTFLFTGGGRNDSGDPYNYYTGQSPAVMQGIVKDHLNGGYPELTKSVTNKGARLDYLFGAGGQAGVTEYSGDGTGLKGLLRKDENGYYYFSSEQNFAKLNDAKDEILVYSESYKKDKPSVNAQHIGFFPFDPYRAGQSKAGEEKGPNGSPYNHQFGMTLEANFVMPPDGKLPNGDEMQFTFSGDDDVWVFVDDVLVLDLGGVHQPLTGTINFAGEGKSKVVDAAVQSVPGQSTIGKEKTLAQIFEDAGEEWDDSPYSTHTIKFFYLERGGCDSNCTLSFNLLMYKTLTIAKELEGLTDEERAKYMNKEFDVDVFVNGQPYNGSDTIRYDSAGNIIEQGFEITDGKAKIKPGEQIRIIGLNPKDTFYAAEENNVSMKEFYPPKAERFYEDAEKHKHEEEVALTEEHLSQADEISDWRTADYPVENTEELMFTNTLREKNLDIEKKWSDGAAKHSNDEVKFKVVAKLKVDGKEYDYTDKITALYSDKTVSERKLSDVLAETYTLSAANDWKAQIEHLPAVNINEGEIFYDIVEIQTANGYAASVKGTDTHNIDVVKIFPHDHTFADEEIQFKLRKGTEGNYKYYNADNKTWGSESAATTHTLNAENHYTYRFHDMPGRDESAEGVPAGEYSYTQVNSTNEYTEGLSIFDRKLKDFEILNSPFNITVGKKWNPASVANENVEGRKIEVTLGRYLLKDIEGNLTIRKEGVPAAADFRANYTVTNTDTNEVFGVYPYVSGGFAVDVPAGNYRVDEEILEDDSTYNSAHGESSKTALVADEGTAEVVFTSTYAAKMGQLRIKSTLEANDTGVSYSGVKYEVYDAKNNKVGEVTFAEASSGDGKTLDLKLGKYTVREVGTPATPQNVKASLKPKKPDNGYREVSALINDETVPAVAEFSAKYTKEVVDTTASVHVSSTHRFPVDKTQQGFHVGDVVRITYRRNNGEQINISSVSGGTIVAGPEQDQAPGNNNGWNATHHVDVKITDQNVDVQFTTTGYNYGGQYDLTSLTNDTTTITLVSSGNRSNSVLNSVKRFASKLTSKLALGAGSPTYTNIDIPESATGTPPTAPEGKKYVNDESFNKVVTLQYGHWAETLSDLPTADANGNTYYYYIKSVHEENMPLTTTSSIKFGDEGKQFLIGSDVNAGESFEVTNTVKGSLKITKKVTVNHEDPTEDTFALVDGTYNFTVAGVEGTATAGITRNASIVITRGQASTKELTDLTPGSYTVTELKPGNGTSLVGDNDVTVVVEPGKVRDAVSSAGLAEMTNNIDITQLTVRKVWTDDGEDGVDHSNHSISYTLYRIPYTIGEDDEVTEYDPEEVESANGYTGVLNANTQPAWTNVITNLPASGEYTPSGEDTAIPVLYEYYVSEGEFEGYKQSISRDSSDRAYSFTITNEPHSSYDKPTDVDIKKAWQDVSGQPAQDAHDDDSITFRLEQKKYSADIYPIRITLINGDGTVSDLSKTIYMPGDRLLYLRADSQSNGNAHRVSVSGTNKDGTHLPTKTVYIQNANGGRDVTFTLQKDGDRWGTEISGTTWKLVMYDTSNNGSVSQNDYIIEEADLLDRILENGEIVENPHDPFDYTMKLDDNKTGTEILKYSESAIGQPEGADNTKWLGSIKDLPFYEKDDDGNFYAYTYEVTEVKIGSDQVTALAGNQEFKGQTPRYYVNWEQNEQTGLWTITNRRKPEIDINVIKMDVDDLESGSATLPGAAFRLEKYTGSDYQNKDSQWTEQEKSDTDNTGRFSFTGLGVGYYQLVETAYPNGYVKAENDPRFRVKKEGGDLVVVLIDAEGKEITNGDSELVKLVDSTLKVGNTPGAELPHTGGIGTTIFYILGSVLVIGCVAVLIFGRRLCRE